MEWNDSSVIGCRRFGLFFFFSVERRTFISIVVQSKNPFFQSFNSIQLFFGGAAAEERKKKKKKQFKNKNKNDR